VQQAGGTVARAKRTDRAEARRRYRATIIDSDQPEDSELEQAAIDEAPAGRSRARSAAPVAPPPRPGIVAAFRNSFRPIDLRGDIQALPSITLHSRAIWLPVLLTVVSAAAFIAQPSNVVTTLLFQYFVFTPPVAAIFLAGFLAPRASYLTGLIAGLAGAIALAIAFPLTFGQLQSAQAATPVATVDQAIQAAFVVSPISGLFFGGAAGWYKRFLNMANPNRAAARPARPGDRNRRRDANNRPLLARRR
jgi:hypothetical protein